MAERSDSGPVQAAVDATRLVFDARTVVQIVVVLGTVGASYHLQRQDMSKSLTNLAAEIQAADARTQLQLSELRADMSTRSELERVRTECEADFADVAARLHAIDMRVTSIEAKVDGGP